MGLATFFPGLAALSWSRADGELVDQLEVGEIGAIEQPQQEPVRVEEAEDTVALAHVVVDRQEVPVVDAVEALREARDKRLPDPPRVRWVAQVLAVAWEKRGPSVAEPGVHVGDEAVQRRGLVRLLGKLLEPPLLVVVPGVPRHEVDRPVRGVDGAELGDDRGPQGLALGRVEAEDAGQGSAERELGEMGRGGDGEVRRLLPVVVRRAERRVDVRVAAAVEPLRLLADGGTHRLVTPQAEAVLHLRDSRRGPEGGEVLAAPGLQEGVQAGLDAACGLPAARAVPVRRRALRGLCSGGAAGDQDPRGHENVPTCLGPHGCSSVTMRTGNGA